jgi:hypothetical protein
LRRIVIAGISVKEPVSHYLIDDLLLEILRATQTGGKNQNQKTAEGTTSRCMQKQIRPISGTARHLQTCHWLLK